MLKISRASNENTFKNGKLDNSKSKAKTEKKSGESSRFQQHRLIISCLKSPFFSK